MGVLQDIRRTNERGHSCDFCVTHAPVVAEHNGQILLLGTAEIRVFANDGLIYAAPSMIFHYASMHHYRPPTEFSRALRNGVKPSEKEYFERLGKLGLGWGATPEIGAGLGGFFRLDQLPKQ